MVRDYMLEFIGCVYTHAEKYSQLIN